MSGRVRPRTPPRKWPKTGGAVLEPKPEGANDEAQSCTPRAKTDPYILFEGTRMKAGASGRTALPDRPKQEEVETKVQVEANQSPGMQSEEEASTSWAEAEAAEVADAWEALDKNVETLKAKLASMTAASVSGELEVSSARASSSGGMFASGPPAQHPLPEPTDSERPWMCWCGRGYKTEAALLQHRTTKGTVPGNCPAEPREMQDGAYSMNQWNPPSKRRGRKPSGWANAETPLAAPPAPPVAVPLGVVAAMAAPRARAPAPPAGLAAAPKPPGVAPFPPEPPSLTPHPPKWPPPSRGPVPPAYPPPFAAPAPPDSPPSPAAPAPPASPPQPHWINQDLAQYEQGARTGGYGQWFAQMEREVDAVMAEPPGLRRL